jgi:hypothetical protein
MTMSRSPEDPRRTMCSAMTKIGDRCRAYASASTGLCCFHDPAKQSEYAKNGGRCSSLRHRAYRRIPEPLSSLLVVLQTAVDEVHSGKLSPSAGSTMSSLVGTIVKALEVADYAKRLEVLETALLKDKR